MIDPSRGDVAPVPATAVAAEVGDPVRAVILTESLAALVAAGSAVAAAEAAQEKAVAAVLAGVRRLREGVESSLDPSFTRVVRHVYWQHPAVGSRALAVAAGFAAPNVMIEAIGSVPSGMVCAYCGTDIRRTSRSWAAGARSRGDLPPSCKRCTDQQHSEWHRKSNEAAARRRAVDEAPVFAGRTDWLVAATLVLAFPPITVGWSEEDAERQGLWLGFDVAQRVARQLARSDHGDDIPVASFDALRLLCVAESVSDWDVERAVELAEPVTGEAPTIVLMRLRRAIEAVRSSPRDMRAP